MSKWTTSRWGDVEVGVKESRRGWLLPCVVVLWAAALWGAVGCGEDQEIPKEEALRIEGVFRAGLRSPEPYMRAETVRAIGVTGSPKLSGLLVEALADETPLVRGSAALRLSRYDLDRAQSHIVGVLTGEDEWARRIVVREVLRGQGGDKLHDAVVSIALRSEDPVVRQRALEYGLIAQLNLEPDATRRDRELIPKLSEVVNDPDPVIAGLALSALHQQGHKARFQALLRETTTGSIKDQKRALRVLSEAHLPGTHEHLKELEGLGEGKRRKEVLVGLTSLGEKAWMDELREELSGADAATTSHIIRALGRNDSHQALRIIRPYREDSRKEVRVWVYRSLGGNPNADASDFKRGLQDEDPEVAIEALRGLLKVAPTFTPTVARELLKDEVQRTRILQVLISALHAVEVDGHVEELDRLESQLQGLEEDLLGMLGDPAPFVRASAAELIFKRRDPMVLYETLKEPRVEVTYALLDALAKSPPAQAPLSHLAFFKRFDDAELESLRIISAAGIWNAYRVAEALQSGG